MRKARHYDRQYRSLHDIMTFKKNTSVNFNTSFSPVSPLSPRLSDSQHRLYSEE